MSFWVANCTNLPFWQQQTVLKCPLGCLNMLKCLLGSALYVPFSLLSPLFKMSVRATAIILPHRTQRLLVHCCLFCVVNAALDSYKTLHTYNITVSQMHEISNKSRQHLWCFMRQSICYSPQSLVPLKAAPHSCVWIPKRILLFNY